MYVFSPFRHIFLFRPRVFLRALDLVAHREPTRTSYPSLCPGRGPLHVLRGLKVAPPIGEAFGACTAIQVHTNSRTGFNNVRWDAHVFQNCASASCTGCLPNPRAHVRVFVIVPE